VFSPSFPDSIRSGTILRGQSDGLSFQHTLHSSLASGSLLPDLVSKRQLFCLTEKITMKIASMIRTIVPPVERLRKKEVKIPETTENKEMIWA